MLSLIFPKNCIFCEKSSSCSICSECAKLVLFDLKPKINYESNGIQHIYFIDLNFKFKKLIHSGKYNFDKKIWHLLGFVMHETMFLNDDEFLSYIPLTWNRFCYRGFNQSLLIAKALSVNRYPVIKVLNRLNYGASAAHSSRTQRIKSAEKSFRICSKDLGKYKKCYLIDDVYTTGATINAAANTIRLNYPNIEVIGLTFARTPKYL